MVEAASLPPDGLDRMVRAVARVKDRLLRAVRALEGAGVSYAVVGGHAVAYWVATADEGAVRNTPDVNILVRRADEAVVRPAMEAAGFVFGTTNGVESIQDRSAVTLREGIFLLYSGELVRPTDELPSPALDDITGGPDFRVMKLDALVQMKLVAHRTKDQVHIRDLIDVGLIDASWPAKYPPPLDERLRHILATPDG